MNFTQLPHKFVYYAPGASGTFVAKVIAGIQSNLLGDIQLTDVGSAHTRTEREHVCPLMITEKIDPTEKYELVPNLESNITLVNDIESAIIDHRRKLPKNIAEAPFVGYTHSFFMYPVIKKYFRHLLQYSSPVVLNLNSWLE